MFIVIIVLLAINITGFINMGYDKHQAKKGKWRTPELRLFLYAFFGGATGIYAGMKVWRHKTQHLSFRIGIPLLIVGNVIECYFIWTKIK